MLDSPVAEVSLGDWQGIASHELAHLFLNLADMYLSFAYGTPAAANDYSLMDDHFTGPHLDAFSKLKLGWVRPKIVFRTDRYTLPDVETRRVVWVLLDPRHGNGEYFLVENRWGGNTYDQHLPDQGLAVWRIMENPCLYRWVEAPPNIGSESRPRRAALGGSLAERSRAARHLRQRPGDAGDCGDARVSRGVTLGSRCDIRVRKQSTKAKINVMSAIVIKPNTIKSAGTWAV